MDDFHIPDEELKRIREDAEERHRAEQERRREEVQTRPSDTETAKSDRVEQPAGVKPCATAISKPENRPSRRFLTSAVWFVGGIVLFFVVAVSAASACKTWISPHISPEPLFHGMTFEEYERALEKDQAGELPSLRSPEGKRWSEKRREWRREQNTLLTVVGFGSGVVFICFYHALYRRYATTDR